MTNDELKTGMEFFMSEMYKIMCNMNTNTILEIEDDLRQLMYYWGA